MWILLRIILGTLMYVAFKEARQNAAVNPMSGDVSNAFWVAVTVILALANGIVWAPYLANKVADPLTGGTIEGEFKEDKRLLLKAAKWCQMRERRRLARWLCFLEATRRPWLPAAYMVGLENAEAGSWLEKVYATEVFKFNNAQNCLKAFEVLKRHGIDPRPHANPGVNMVLISQEREIKPTPEKMEVPAAPPPPELKRDERIKIGL
jgi:hypothetical protein